MSLLMIYAYIHCIKKILWYVIKTPMYFVKLQYLFSRIKKIWVFHGQTLNLKNKYPCICNFLLSSASQLVAKLEIFVVATRLHMPSGGMSLWKSTVATLNERCLWVVWPISKIYRLAYIKNKFKLQRCTMELILMVGHCLRDTHTNIMLTMKERPAHYWPWNWSS